MKEIRSFLSVLSVFLALASGCAPTNPTMPLRPLDAGETYSYIHLTVPFSNFSRFNLQWSIAHGVSGEDVLGCTLAYFLIPASLNYSRHLSGGEHDEFMQMYMNLSEFNPFLEIDYVISSADGRTTNAGRFGMGINLNLFPTSARHWNFRLVPVAEYTVEHRDARFSLGTRIGMTKAVIGNARYQKEKVRYEFVAAEIDTILVDPAPQGDEYGIVLSNGRMLNIRSSMPFADCLICPMDYRIQKTYTASRDHRAFWVFYSDAESPRWMTGHVSILQLNMSAIVERMGREGTLVITEDDDVEERTLRSFNPWIEDLYLDAGYVIRHRD